MNPDQIDRSSHEHDHSASQRPTTASTTWRDATPTDGAVGRLVLKADPSVVLPVTIVDADEDGPMVRITGTSSGNVMNGAEWTFQVEQPPLPTTPGSVVKQGDALFVLTAEDEQLPWYDVITGKIRHASKMDGATVLFDAGAVGS
jgi:hypothetical protein